MVFITSRTGLDPGWRGSCPRTNLGWAPGLRPLCQQHPRGNARVPLHFGCIPATPVLQQLVLGAGRHAGVEVTHVWQKGKKVFIRGKPAAGQLQRRLCLRARCGAGSQQGLWLCSSQLFYLPVCILFNILGCGYTALSGGMALPQEWDCSSCWRFSSGVWRAILMADDFFFPLAGSGIWWRSPWHRCFEEQTSLQRRINLIIPTETVAIHWCWMVSRLDHSILIYFYSYLPAFPNYIHMTVIILAKLSYG